MPWTTKINPGIWFIIAKTIEYPKYHRNRVPEKDFGSGNLNEQEGSRKRYENYSIQFRDWKTTGGLWECDQRKKFAKVIIESLILLNLKAAYSKIQLTSE